MDPSCPNCGSALYHGDVGGWRCAACGYPPEEAPVPEWIRDREAEGDRMNNLYRLAARDLQRFQESKTRGRIDIERLARAIKNTRKLLERLDRARNPEPVLRLERQLRRETLRLGPTFAGRAEEWWS